MKPQLQSRILSGVVVALVIGMAAASTFAHDGPMAPGANPADMARRMMAQVDSNHDGSISAAEHAAHAQAMFQKMDANHDGMVSQAELEAGMKAMHDMHGMHDMHHMHGMHDSDATAGDDHHDAEDATKPDAPPSK